MRLMSLPRSGGSAFLLFCLTTPFTVVPSTASITVYYQAQQTIAAQATQTTVSGGNYTGLAAYNPTTLIPPSLPSPLPSAAFNIQLGTADTVQGMSIKHPNPFYGFSIEMSVTNQLREWHSLFFLPQTCH